MAENSINRRSFIQGTIGGLAAAGLVHVTGCKNSEGKLSKAVNTDALPMPVRPFGKTDWKISSLGFGCMRLPLLPDAKNSGDVDESEAIRIIRYAVDQGVNYVDTAWPYHKKNSEIVVGKALKDGYREKVKLATKLPCWEIHQPSDFDKYLDMQLERLQTESIDVYLIHALWEDRWKQMKEMHVFDSAEKAMADGRIKHLAFSIHDSFEIFKDIVDYYDNWTMAQIQYNFLNENVQAGTRGYNYAVEKGLAVVIMEPLLGGLIAEPPENVQKVWEKAGKNAADMSLRWLWDKPGISTVLSGMTTLDEVKWNIQSAKLSGIRIFSQAEYQFIDKVKKAYAELPTIPCTRCRYCMPCSNGVDIPHIFELYNASLINYGLNRNLYRNFLKDSEKASACVQCGICERRCPQRIPIMEWLSKMDEHFKA